MTHLRRTIEIPHETVAQLMASLGGHKQAPPPRREDVDTELATTQNLAIVSDEMEIKSNETTSRR